MVTAGLYLGWRSPRMQTSQVRLQLAANWETVIYLLNGFCFLLIGLQLRSILETIKSYPASQLVLWTATAALSPILIRFVWSFTVIPIYARLRHEKDASWKHLFVFSWSGMRGVVSLAAALALPLSCANGQCFPFRDLLIFMTVIVIASTLILQGVSLPAVVRKFGFTPDQSHKEEEERRARLFISREGVRRMDELARAHNIDLDDPEFQKMLNKYLDHAIANINVDNHNLTTIELLHSMQIQTISAQRSVS